MQDWSHKGAQPAVSIILPTYNRARFLPQAFASMRSQTFTDWELIIIDDGSTDDTRHVVSELIADLPQPVQYIYQENQGPYGARNTGLEHAKGTYLAFYDSDDIWLPHHLQDCVEGLDANPDVDWVYGACRIVDEATGRILTPTTFYVEGKPRPFLQLKSRIAGKLHIIEDPHVICRVLPYGHGLQSGLQNSVIRSALFSKRRFEAVSRNEAEDQLLVIKALLNRHRFAFIDNVHVIYRVHAENSSAAAKQRSLDKQIKIHRLLLAGWERLPEEVALRRCERRALQRRLSQLYFWHLGYALLWQNERPTEALTMFWRGLQYWPWSLHCWKTYLLCLMRTKVARGCKYS
jgi:glycosyltransferase involved in cell wall biosynthesis